MNTKKEYYVYMHTNKLNQKKYIGITRQNPVKRWNNGNGYSTQPFYKAIEKYKWNNFDHIILYEKLNYKQACEYEKILIAKYKTTDRQFGYNYSDGGEDCISYYNNLIHHNKTVYQYTFDGKLNHIYESVNEAAKSLEVDNIYASTNISDAARKFNENKSAYGYIWSYVYMGDTINPYSLQDSYGEQNRIKIYQYDLDGNFLNSFKSINDASEFFEVSIQSISYAVDQKHRASCNCQWRTFLKEDGIEAYSQKPNRNYNLKKKIVRISKNDLSIKQYDGLSDAMVDMKLNDTHNISGALSKIQPSAYGYFWFYYNEYEDGSWKNKISFYRAQRKVYVYDKNFNEHVYDSLKSLCNRCEKDLGVKFGKPSVCNVCNGKEKIHKNYVFSYTKLTNEQISEHFIPKTV